LLQRLGYRNVKVTKFSGDADIDARATLIAGGVANIETVVQAKRRKGTIDRPEIQKFRGAISVHEAGLFVTCGTFTPGAVAEASAAGRTPIALVNGAQLVDLLMDHEIGVRATSRKTFIIDSESLMLERLETLMEEVEVPSADS